VEREAPAVAEVKAQCEQQQRLDAVQLSDEQKAQVRALASDFPRLWRDPQTPDRDRKRMARLLLEDVTLRREQQEIRAQLRFKGGATRELRVPFPKRLGPCGRPNRKSSRRSTGYSTIIAREKLLNSSMPKAGAPVAGRRSPCAWSTIFDGPTDSKAVTRDCGHKAC